MTTEGSRCLKRLRNQCHPRFTAVSRSHKKLRNQRHARFSTLHTRPKHKGRPGERSRRKLDRRAGSRMAAETWNDTAADPRPSRSIIGSPRAKDRVITIADLPGGGAPDPKAEGALCSLHHCPWALILARAVEALASNRIAAAATSA
jgi:hypothetical protein